MREVINEYLSQFDLDVRKSHDARFMDQKCTPDVVCFIADSVISTIIDIDKPFTVNDIWNSQYFIKNAKAVFNKPLPTNKTARHEYDKFIQQPLRMLGYANILEVTKIAGTNYFRIINSEILDYIARKERNAYNFLYCYFKKVLKDSDMWKYFEEYRTKCFSSSVTNADFSELKEKYIRFIIGHTKVNGDVEVKRMFPKILNVYAVENGINGTEKGHMSKYPFTFSDLMYNRKNWRDLNKDKSMTRQEALQKQDVEQQEAYNQYYVQKAMNLLRKIQDGSEVHDQWDNGEATQIHHIFPRSQYPQIAYYIENMIKLTATQHFTKAHPNNRTQTINRDYQLTCLLAKADTIDKSLQMFGEKYYRKESFVYVINTGLATDFSTSLTFRDIKTKLIEIYNAA